ncbi:MAG: DUF4268 domain-containing protein [Fusobacteriaceae bacterium]
MFGRLEQVDLREIWKHEAFDFSQWLAKDENVNLLSDAVGIEIEVEETEAKVGSFSADILARDINTDRKIIIENQLEKTDHDHLGKIITYAAGYDAKTIIWIVKQGRDEHRKAVEWLNNYLDEEINVFLIEIQLWKIGGSPVAPKFNILESPNSWAKKIKRSINVTDVKNLQRDYWIAFVEYCKEKKTSFKLRTPMARQCFDIAIGNSEYQITLTINTLKNSLGLALYIPDSKELYHKFSTYKEEIEEKLGFQMEWIENPGKKSSKIVISHGTNFRNSGEWEDSFRWLLEKIEIVKSVFGDFVSIINLNQ